MNVACLATVDSVAARGIAWRRICLRHRQGWPSLEEAIQIRWSPDKTVTGTAADSGGQGQTGRN